jgi:hypothetical protein
VRSLALLGGRAIEAMTRRGILLLHDTGVFMRGHRMRPATKWALDTFGPAYGRVMAPPHAPSALSGTGPRGSTSDLTVAAANDDLLTNKVSGVAARNRVCDVNPRDTSVSVRRSAHKVRSMFDELVEQNADRR